MPFYIPIQSTTVPYGVFHTDRWQRDILPMPVIVSGATNTTATTYSVSQWVPADCNKVDLLITHTHVGTTSAGIIIGPIAAFYQTVLTTAVAGSYQLRLTIPVTPSLGFDAYLSAVASTTSYTISLAGYYTTCSL
jgi:hypothetical protein